MKKTEQKKIIDNRLMPWQKKKQLNWLMLAVVVFIGLSMAFIYFRLVQNDTTETKKSTTTTDSSPTVNDSLDVRNIKPLEEVPSTDKTPAQIVEDYKQTVTTNTTTPSDPKAATTAFSQCMSKNDLECANQIVEITKFTDSSLKAELYKALATKYEAIDKAKALENYQKALNATKDYTAAQPNSDNDAMIKFYQDKINQLSKK